jgi:hypothetical protein
MLIVRATEVPALLYTPCWWSFHVRKEKLASAFPAYRSCFASALLRHNLMLASAYSLLLAPAPAGANAGMHECDGRHAHNKY